MIEHIDEAEIEIYKGETVAYIVIKWGKGDDERAIRLTFEPMEIAVFANELVRSAMSFPQVAQALREARERGSAVEQGSVNEVRGSDSEAGSDDSESGVQRVSEGDSGPRGSAERPTEEV